MDENDIYFETEDFRGRRIICTKSQWYDHVVEGTHHRYMDGAEDDVIDALRNPHNNHRSYDRIYKNRRVYYKYNRTWNDYLKVVVLFEDDSCSGTGKVWTAYQQDRITKGERPEL